MAASENIVFFNGRLRPESQVGIPIRDSGFIHGDAAFDATRTFNGAPFRLRQHVHRLYDSLRYLRIDPGMSEDEIERWSLEVVNHNYALLPDNQDMWVMQRISRGVEATEPGEKATPTVLIESHAIPFARRAKLYRDGVRVITPSVPRVPPRFISPRAKTHNYLNMVLGELEAQAADPDSWAVLLDENGNLSEGRGSNVFLVKDGVVSTPQAQFVLAGITRGTVLELAAGLGLPDAGEGLGPVRRLRRRRGISHFHEPLHMPGILGQRGCNKRGFRRRPHAGPHYAEVDVGLQRSGGYGLRGPIPATPSGLGGFDRA